MPRTKSQPSTQTSEPQSRTSARRAGASQSSGSIARQDRQLKVLHKGLGPHPEGAIIDQSVLGDRANLRRLLGLHAIEWYVPPIEEPPDLEEDDDLEDEFDEGEESDNESEIPEESDATNPKVASPVVASPLLPPLLKPVVTPNVQASGVGSPATRVQDLGKK